MTAETVKIAGPILQKDEEKQDALGWIPEMFFDSVLLLDPRS